MKHTDNKIEWLVALSVVLITTSRVLWVVMNNFGFPIVETIFNYTRFFIVFLILQYQINHYGFKVYHKFFALFYVLYLIYVILYMTVLRKWPLNEMLSVPRSNFVLIYQILISLAYLLSAQTIIYHINLKKILALSLLLCTIPTILLIYYVGIDRFQMDIRGEDDEHISFMATAYANVPLIIIAAVFWRTLFEKKQLSIIVSSAIFIVSAFILFVCGTRGAILWAIIGFVICNIIRTKKIRKTVVALSLMIILVVAFLKPIVGIIKQTLPRTGERIENTIFEGDTDARFNLDDLKNSTFMIGIENFQRSPILGYYFRLDSNNLHFRGAYPHNIFIEVLMTMGIIGFIPFMVLLFRAFQKTRYIFIRNYSDSEMVCFIFFMSSFLHLQTSGTLLFDHSFWLFFYILCCIDLFNKEMLRNHSAVSKKDY